MIEGRTGKWEMVLGLEVHAQVTSKAKLFSGAATEFGAEPNTQVSFVDAAFPGMLPVINRKCVEQAVRTGLGLKAQINLRSVFDRKNYFYPDLPAGYQISQYTQPVVGKGAVVVDLPSGESRTVGITRLHLEQDAGKSLHDQSPSETYVDLNRAGVALMEIVSEPDMRSAEEAAAYLRKLRSILRYLGTCDGNMEEGSMRCDVNVSVRKPGDTKLGTRCEIKNVNSVRFVMQAIEYEARRQVEILEDGGKIDQETRLFDSVKGETRSMRSKEDAHDYRYFPDPDLLPLVLDPAWVEGIKKSLPELPDDKKARFVSAYGMSAQKANELVADKDVADAWEEGYKNKTMKRKFSPDDEAQVKSHIANPEKHGIAAPLKLILTTSSAASVNSVFAYAFSTANALAQSSPSLTIRANEPQPAIQKSRDVSSTEFAKRVLEEQEKTQESLPAIIIKKLDLDELQALQETGVISSRMAKEVYAEMERTGKSPSKIVEERGLKQVTDAGEIEREVDAALAGLAAKVAEYRAKDEAGRAKMFGFFVGQVMKRTGGKANPAAVNELLKKKLAT